jgi:hypothetical protein
VRRYALAARAVITIIGGGLFLLGTPADAARLLAATVERDGRVVLQTMFQDTGREDVGTVWTYLDGAAFEPVGDVPADPADPRSATLTGDVRLVIAGARGAAAAVSELRLVRAAADEPRWRLAPGEVARTAAAAGITRPQVGWWPVAASAAGAAALLAGAVWLARLLRRSTVAPPAA